MSNDQRPLRILHLTLGADAGGLSQYIITLGTAMQRLGHENIVAGDSGAWDWAFQKAQLKYIRIPLKGNILQFQRSKLKLKHFLRETPVDVIHTHYRRATLLGRRLQRGLVPPILYTLHLSHISLKFPHNLFTDFGDHTHAASEDARRWLVDDAHVDPTRIRFIPHGVDTNHYSITTARERDGARKQLNLRQDETVAIFVGRLDYPKNEEWLIDIAAATQQTNPFLKFILIGEGPHEEMLKNKIAEKQLTDRVRVVGYQDPLVYYRAADAILLPSVREGFSLVCAEAMSTGIPALRTRTSGTSELIVENVTGRSTAIDHDAFVGEAIDFLHNRDTLRTMGAAAAEHVRSRFSFDLQLSRTLDLYRSIAKVKA